MSLVTISTYIESLLNAINFKNNPYFINLLDGNFDKEDFTETQIQLFHTTHFFTQILGALVSKVPESPSKINIIENLYEEHGEGFVDQYHRNTFLSFLNHLGVKKEDIEKRVLWPEVREFNIALLGTSKIDEYLVSVPAIGCIEYMFLSVAKWTEQALLKRRWLKQEQILYYKIRKELDFKHAQDFFDVVTINWFKSEEDRYYIEQGIKLGCYSFNQLYINLYNNRKKREYRDVTTPHFRLKL